MNIAVLTHSHSDCKDVLGIFIQEFDHYIHDIFHQHFLMNVGKNSLSLDIQEYFYYNSWAKYHQYNDTDPFHKRIKDVLEKIDDEYILFTLEDYIPYSYSSASKINNILSEMDKNKSIGFVRLIHSGVVEQSKYNDFLTILNPDSPYFFSTQMTIWRKDVLFELMSKAIHMNTVRDEIYGSSVLKDINTTGLVYSEKGNKVGGHYDSTVIPYIATACCGGKWNISEYPILTNILERYGIDPSVRGYR